jgi:hypothetical protein
LLELNEFEAEILQLNLQNASQQLGNAGTLSMDIFYPGDENTQFWNGEQIPIALFSKPRN